MTFQENLIRFRKIRGWSQEELAGRVNVSRQAVSKWETGESVPDLPKLIALADALELSLDILCGREADAAGHESKSRKADITDTKNTVHTEAGKRRKSFLTGLLALCLVIGLIGGYLGSKSLTAAPTPLPDTITVDGVKFSRRADSNGLFFQFVPSVIDEDCTYQISFAAFDSTPVTYDVVCDGGVCSGKVSPGAYNVYDTVTLTVSNGAESRAIPLASSLSYKDNQVSWLPPA